MVLSGPAGDVGVAFELELELPGAPAASLRNLARNHNRGPVGPYWTTLRRRA